jgi:dolichyl-phosphate-mannose--protein O-mannosyl transferase
MKSSQLFLIIYAAILFISLIVSGALLSLAVDLTIESGLVIHKKYIVWVLISVAITIFLFYYKKRLPFNEQ